MGPFFGPYFFLGIKERLGFIRLRLEPALLNHFGSPIIIRCMIQRNVKDSRSHTNPDSTQGPT